MPSERFVGEQIVKIKKGEKAGDFLALEMTRVETGKHQTPVMVQDVRSRILSQGKT